MAAVLGPLHQSNIAFARRIQYPDVVGLLHPTGANDVLIYPLFVRDFFLSFYPDVVGSGEGGGGGGHPLLPLHTSWMLTRQLRALRGIRELSTDVPGERPTWSRPRWIAARGRRATG